MEVVIVIRNKSDFSQGRVTQIAQTIAAHTKTKDLNTNRDNEHVALPIR